MLKERRNLLGSIIAKTTNWTTKKIILLLANEGTRQEEEYNRLLVEFDANGQRHTENTL